ncbi:hypothetical protein [Burkholderia vietnamiensis]|uniref:hypothetical protein n=1 Tax=Burkholderia vietnamiensis TaxID=60552 RepID=UPI0012D9AD02|nr:hypothetical protein [Burkholderia vietnamiensis]
MYARKKMACIFMALGVFLLTDTAANAQSGSNKWQTGRQWRNRDLPVGTLTSPHLGVTHGSDGQATGGFGSIDGKASASNGQARNSISVAPASASPLLGAPKSYDTRYEANLGEELDGKRSAARSEGYSRTPMERLLARESAASIAGYAGQSSLGKNLKRNNRAATLSYRVSHSGSSGGSDGTISRSSIYRSPW